tara:strand:- start:3773 stop:4738 length:966 start_codon:yes stop_codon:yes gene_type:complete
MFFKVTNETNSTVVSSGSASSLEDWKQKSGYYGPDGLTSAFVDDFVWYEIPDYIFDDVLGGTTAGGSGGTGAYGLRTFDGTTAGTDAGTGPAVFGATASQIADGIFDAFNIDDENTDVTSIPALVPSNLGVVLADDGVFNRIAQGSDIIDPRLTDNFSLGQLQEVKELEAKNDFEGDDGLGRTQDISFELDNGSQQVATFNSARKTIIDLVAVKNYKDLNLSIIPTTSVESVNATKIKVIDDAGTILSLSPAEFDRMLYAFLRIFYEKYTTVVDMTNTIKSPIGTTVIQQKQFLNNKTNVALKVSAASSFVSESLSTSGGK